MDLIKIENLSFCYPNATKKALNDISLNIKKGEFVCLMGKSGCGKTTLLKLLKPALAPFGDLNGRIYFEGENLTDLNLRKQTCKIGFVMQNPDNQIVTDKVWHELAFGLESLGLAKNEIRSRVSEMAAFFGIESLFHKKTTDLSGGQKQILSLASVMVMQPEALILDEPTSQLDPVAASEFLAMLKKINREMGTTVIISEHRLEEVFPLSDKVIVLNNGKLISSGTPIETGKTLKDLNSPMYLSLPSPMRIYGEVENETDFPLTVGKGRIWLENFAKRHKLFPELIPESNQNTLLNPAIELKDVWFRYEKSAPDIIKGMNLKVYPGETFALLGGNGSGKTTTLSLISRLNVPYLGKILINGENISKCKDLYNGILGVLPQNPQLIFVKKTLRLDLLEILSEKAISPEEKERKIQWVSSLCKIENLLSRHPYDLSGGEQQKAALAKILLLNPKILLLDEPTKGVDAHFKQVLGDILKDLKQLGTTIILVSHDIEFCAEFADRCALMFDGNITSTGKTREFFSSNSFYTTSANKMAKTTLTNAITANDVILACGKKLPLRKQDNIPIEICRTQQQNTEVKKTSSNKGKLIAGFVFAALFLSIYILSVLTEIPQKLTNIIHLLAAVFLGLCFYFFIPHNKQNISVDRKKDKLSKRTIISALFILALIPITLFWGSYALGDRKYYFISLLIILEVTLPFLLVFESRKPKARELVIISVLCAMATAGRGAFVTLPQFKPVLAIVIISGVCFGGEAGFLVGTVTGFVSNFFFGQGPWTPWQMIAFGIVGFVAGILFEKGIIKKARLSLCIYGALATIILFGGIVNTQSFLAWYPEPTLKLFIITLIQGLPYDLIHAASTVFFLYFLAEPMIEKLERIKTKYGI